MKQEKSNIGIHFFYVTLILIATIVLLATAKWTELPKFTDYISTAGTITSLVLGILAIIYSFVSNDSISQSSGVLRDTADSAKKAALEVENFLGDFKILDENTRSNNESVNKIINQLSISLASLEKSTASLAEQNCKFHEAIEKIPSEIKDLGVKFDSVWVGSNSKGENLNTGSKISSSLVTKFIENSSPRGKLLCYWIYKSYTTKKTFSIRDVFFTIQDDVAYEHGYFVAMSSIGLIKSSSKDKQENISYIAEGFSAIENSILTIDIFKDEPELQQMWDKEISRAKSYFEEVTSK